MLIPIILCGGSGSRLWPVSRETHPKPFMRLSDGQSLLQKAFIRGAILPDVAEVMTVTNTQLLSATRDDYASVNTQGLPTRFVLEPFGRNTAAAVAVAALLAQAKHGDSVTLLLLPADHLIANQAAFAGAVSQAQALAQQGLIVTFGIVPDAPETGFGYIETDGNRVKRFVEKPDLATAQTYLASGKYLWNSGMLCFTAGAMLADMAVHCPDVLTAAQDCLALSVGDDHSRNAQSIELDSASFAKLPDVSIDYALMEKTTRAAVVPCDIGWSDIGSWSAISALTPPDEHGNRVVGHAVMQNTSGCYIQSDRTVGTVGVSDLVIVDTPDALLIANGKQSQDVKHLYAQLKGQGHDAYKVHRTVHRPWGTYTVLEEGPNFKIKRIEVKPGAALSLQMHHHRSEHWIVVSGTARVINGDSDMLLQTNESTYIPAGHKHRLTNPGIIPLQIIEVQSGQYLGEDDIVRFSDQYGRDVQPQG